MSRICSADAAAGCVVTDQRPNGVADYARIDGTPERARGVLAVLGLARARAVHRGVRPPPPP
jgi:hypothetical protein